MFTFPHRAFRRLWLSVIGKIGTTDWRDPEEVAELVPLINLACDGYIEHNHIESEYLLKDLSQHEPTLCEHWLKEHLHHIDELKSFKEQIKHINELKDHEERAKEGILFANTMHMFLSVDLAHMSFEEREVSVLINKHLTKAQLDHIEHEIATHLDPKFMQQVTPYFILGSDTNSLVHISKIVHMATSKAPPFAWAGFCNTVKSILSERAYKKALGRFPALDGQRRD